MALDRLFGEEEPHADFAVHEPVGDELQDLDLPGRRLLLELGQGRLERDDLGDRSVAPRGDGFEARAMLLIARQNLVALGSVHRLRIGRGKRLL